jgi:hypothetical protein
MVLTFAIAIGELSILATGPAHAANMATTTTNSKVFIERIIGYSIKVR